MSSSLFSSSWYRAGTLRPRLRKQASFSRHVYRGETWYVLQDLATGKFMRLNPAAHRVVVLMDGQRTLEDIWRHACLHLGDEAPTQDELLQLLGQLHQANVLLTDRRPDLYEIGERGRKSRQQKLKQYLANPLALKLPLFDPDRLLTHLSALIPYGTVKWLLLVWLALVCTGIVGAAMHWNELTADIASRVFTSENMLLLALVFPILKALHELGHGIAIKRAGGSCHEMGLMFLIFLPIPYVDASQATGLPDKRLRMLIGLAGMMAELAVASVAVWLWSWASPGLPKAVLHQVILLAGVTTVLFNANPLLRFDGYYVLADWLEIPNLATKANSYIGFLINRHLFGVQEAAKPPQLTPRESRWLLFFAISSFVYRIFITVAIVLLLAGQFFFIGVLLALWATYGMLGVPLLKHLKYLAGDGTLDGHRRRAWLVTGSGVAVVMLFLFFVPTPSWTMAEGVIWMPEESRLRAPVACFGERVLVKPGTRVAPNTPLLACAEPEIDAQIARYQAEIAEVQQRMMLADTEERVRAQILQSEMRYAQARLEDLRVRQAAMIIQSSHAGQFVMFSPGDFPGRYLQRGDVVGYVLDPGRFTLLAVIPHGEVNLVRKRTVRVELRSADAPTVKLLARVVREVPAASTELPSLAFSLQGGGEIGLDPHSDPSGAAKSLTPLFQVELAFSGDGVPQTLGNRVYVRFVHYPEPLAQQWYRSLRQVFLKHFEV